MIGYFTITIWIHCRKGCQLLVQEMAVLLTRMTLTALLLSGGVYLCLADRTALSPIFLFADIMHDIVFAHCRRLSPLVTSRFTPSRDDRKHCWFQAVRRQKAYHIQALQGLGIWLFSVARSVFEDCVLSLLIYLIYQHCLFDIYPKTYSFDIIHMQPVVNIDFFVVILRLFTLNKCLSKKYNVSCQNGEFSTLHSRAFFSDNRPLELK